LQTQSSNPYIGLVVVEACCSWSGNWQIAAVAVVAAGAAAAAASKTITIICFSFGKIYSKQKKKTNKYEN